MENYRDALSHHGITGMKWGVWNEETRRKRLGTKRRPSNSSAELKRRKKERERAAKNASLLSDRELDRRIKRLEKEKRFRELSASEVTPGKQYAKDFLDQNGKKVAGIIITAVAVELGKELVESRINSRKIASGKHVK